MFYTYLGLSDPQSNNQYWHAYQERRVSLGELAPFPQCHEYDWFHIDSIVDNGDGTFTITDGSKSWQTSPFHRWLDATPGSGGVPEWSYVSFDVVIDADRVDEPGLSEPDFRTVFQASLTDHTATTLEGTGNLAKFCSELDISVGDLAGREGWILRAGATVWTRGYVRWGNSPYWTKGTVAASAAGTLTSDEALGHVADLVGQEVVYEAGGILQRGAVTGADPDTRVLTYTGTAAAAGVGDDFYVIAPGAYFQFGRTPGSPQCAYAGLRTNYVTHQLPADGDGTTVVGKPRLTEPVMYGENSLSCPVSPTDVTLYCDEDGLDVDYYLGFMNVCGTADEFLAPNWWQCFRHLWSGFYRLANAFCKPGSVGGALDPGPFSYATWLDYAGINSFTATAGTHSGTTLPVSLGVPHTPVNIWVSVLDDDDRPILSFYVQDYDGTQISHADIGAAHDGKTVVASVGPTRVCRKEVDSIHDVTYFIPDLDGGGSPVVPPTNTHPGTYVTIPAATHYQVADITTGQIGRGSLDRHEVTDGDVVRLVGHRFHDPGFPVTLPADADTLAPYHNYGYVGLRSKNVQAAIDASMRGTATGGSNVRLEHDGRDWLAVDFYDASNGLTHTGTFTAGSTTGGTDSAQAGTGLWDAARFPAGTLVGFTVEVLMSGSSFSDPAAVIAKRLIATGNGATGALTWSEALPATANGKQYRIREPNVPNRWKGMKLHLDNGTDSATVEILGNHDDTLYFADPGFTVDATCTYEIDPVLRVGDTGKRVSGAWVSTAGLGADSRFGGATFLDTPESNQPDVFFEYGLPQPMDVTPHTRFLHEELEAAISALQEFQLTTGDWDDPADNNRHAGWHNETLYSNWSNFVVNGSAGEPGNTGYYLFDEYSVSGAPFAIWDTWSLWTWTGAAWTNTGGYVGNVARQFNRFRVTPPQTHFPKLIKFFAKAERWGTTSSTVTGSSFSVLTSDYDDQGDGLAEDVYSEWDSQTVTTGDAVSIDLGSLDVPVDAGAPSSGELPSGTSPGNTGGVTHERGYKVTGVIVTCRPTYVFG